jgi:hypothetical protein
LRSQRQQQFAQALADLVEVSQPRIGEAHVDAATTPPAFGFGLGGFFAVARIIGDPA